MFNYLTKSLSGILDSLKRKGILTEDDIKTALREIRISLIEADVALPAIKHVISKISEKALGAEVLKSITPDQMIVKIVHDELIEILKHKGSKLELNFPAPVIIVMTGLQGAGKTTTTAKIALKIKNTTRKKVLLASVDTRRPAARKQLEVLGKQIDVATVSIIDNENPIDITTRALKEAKYGNYDVLIIDTAGRSSINEELIKELKDICKLSNPAEILLVADCMMGQEAVNIAKHFHDAVRLTGIVLSKAEGDDRGGAALSMSFVTGVPIKFIGTGEKPDNLEEFKPESMASRILGMGDIVSLVDKITEATEQAESEKMLKKLQKGRFDMNDLLSQFRTMKKLGGMSSILGMIPGLGKLKESSAHLAHGEAMFKKQEAIIYSMTKNERKDPAVINPSRKKRIAAGSGTSIQDVNKLLKQHLQMSKMMKKMGQGGFKDLAFKLMSQ